MEPTGPFASDSADEHDTAAEVDASFRTLRRVGVGHVLLFAGVVAAIPVLAVVLGWWSEGRILGGMSPMFTMAAFGLYVFFFAIGLAAATLANAVEARMLGGPGRAAHRPGDTPPR